jgi:hypothetical protein
LRRKICDLKRYYHSDHNKEDKIIRTHGRYKRGERNRILVEKIKGWKSVVILMYVIILKLMLKVIGCASVSWFNPLNTELNPICHLLILLGDLTLMGPCILSIFQYISNKMQRYTVYLYLETALHVSDGTSTHHQERIQLYLQHLTCHTVTAICRYRGRVGTG